ncbi:MAG TPA: adenosylcobalamin-dependent ribonucleoside-diphosphate reductase [Dehalococcoidia bacterium]|nr:adenosylcobalamin-dependent ribonucleoside-diphosphate reductase [Dehalococcoidia bacterium]
MTTTLYPQETRTAADGRPAIGIGRFYTKPGIDPYSLIEWDRRTAAITDESGKAVFEQTDVEVPSFWSQTATQVVASKYFRGRVGTPERESSARQMVDRIVNVITAWGMVAGCGHVPAPELSYLRTAAEGGSVRAFEGSFVPCPSCGTPSYFSSEDEASAFANELRHILINQLACFNSPVWFNVGVKEKPQCSACFILSVEDSMDSILEWCRTEGMIFKGGSGSGINLSTIRSSREHLSGGGIASGPVSFMRGADAIAGSIKSGGTTRRAAKMVVLNADHPDILDFIQCKAREEKKAYDLGAAGWDMSLNGEAWASVQFQNANNSVRATDDFMRAAIKGAPWELRAVTTGEVIETVNARDVLKAIAQAAWECGDPGMQFHTTINDWHTCSNTGPINASNPCSEYMHVDDSACNLASINLLKFLRKESGNGKQEGDSDFRSVLGGAAAGSESGASGRIVFDVEAFRHTVDVMITAQEIIVGHSSYPTEKIERNAHAMRQLGLGYANLGALLMTLGLPYDSDEGRSYAAAITALMTGRAYGRSAAIAARVGPFSEYERNREPMLRVIRKHREAAYAIDSGLVGDPGLVKAATSAWDDALEMGERYGYRNAQATVLAPTGTIAFMMDCDTTGVEPDIALIKYKKLVGGGMLRIVNQTVPVALARLGYDSATIEGIVRYIDEEGTIEGAPGLQEKHLPVFDCAFRAEKGVRSIHPMGHVKMMGAIQPFISGAISKTVNVPNEATVEDIEEVFIESWRQGVKAIAIYRDGSKAVQPLSTSKDGGSAKQEPGQAEPSGPVRRRLPDTRRSIAHKFSIQGHEGYLHVGMYDDGQPGEIFVTMAKEGSTISGLMDAFATSISLTLQYGVPLRDLVQKFSHMRFEPMGMTENREIPMAQSIIDYIFRWLASQFLSDEDKRELGIMTVSERLRLEAPFAGVQPELVPAPVQPIPSVLPIAGGSVEASAPPAVPNGHAPANGNGGSTTAAHYHGPRVQADAPACANCGWIMTRSGTCYRCENCGSTSGCS